MHWHALCQSQHVVAWIQINTKQHNGEHAQRGARQRGNGVRRQRLMTERGAHMQTWATLAAKHATLTSGIGLGAIPAVGWDSLDGVAVGALLAGVGFAVLNSPRRAQSCQFPLVIAEPRRSGAGEPAGGRAAREGQAAGGRAAHRDAERRLGPDDVASSGDLAGRCGKGRRRRPVGAARAARRADSARPRQRTLRSTSPGPSLTSTSQAGRRRRPRRGAARTRRMPEAAGHYLPPGARRAHVRPGPRRS